MCPGAAFPGEVCFLCRACHDEAGITVSLGAGDRRCLSCVSFEMSRLHPWRQTPRGEKIREPGTQPHCLALFCSRQHPSLKVMMEKPLW